MFKETFLEELKQLAAIQGSPGQEQEVVKYLVEQLKPYADEIEVDQMGNLYAYKNGKTPGPTIMVSAHSDEIGCMVRDIDDHGFIRVERTGGMLEALMVGRKVSVNGHLGIIGSKAGHLQSPDERTKVPPIKDLYVDVGVKSRDEVHQLGITVGDSITYVSEIEQFSNPDLICGKAIDNRSCCVLLLELFKSLDDGDFSGTLVGVVAVQEEVGLRGARVATYKVNPDYAFVLDTIPCADTPDTFNSGYPVGIGHGPVIPLLAGGGARGNIMAPKMKDLIVKMANKAEVPYQLTAMSPATTDIAAVHLEREGVLAGAIAFARRYSHSPVEMADLNDFESGLKLLEILIRDQDNWGNMDFIG